VQDTTDLVSADALAGRSGLASTFDPKSVPHCMDCLSQNYCGPVLCDRIGPNRAGQDLGWWACWWSTAEHLLVVVHDVRVGEQSNASELADCGGRHREWITERLRTPAGDALESSLCMAEIGILNRAVVARSQLTHFGLNLFERDEQLPNLVELRLPGVRPVSALLLNASLLGMLLLEFPIGLPKTSELAVLPESDPNCDGDRQQGNHASTPRFMMSPGVRPLSN
jgi:hypothetical protein